MMEYLFFYSFMYNLILLQYAKNNIVEIFIIKVINKFITFFNKNCTKF